MRWYAVFEYVQDVLPVLKSNIIVSELKSKALNDRRWKEIFKALKLSAQISFLLQFNPQYDTWQWI